MKSHRVTEWIVKRDTILCCLQENDITSKDTNRLRNAVTYFKYMDSKSEKPYLFISSRIDLNQKP